MIFQILDDASFLQFKGKFKLVDTALLGYRCYQLGRYLVCDNHLRQLSVNLGHQLGSKISFIEVHNIVQQEFLAATITKFIDRQTQSAAYLLQLANLATAGAQFADSKHIGIIPTLLQRPFREDESAHVPAAVLIFKR